MGITANRTTGTTGTTKNGDATLHQTVFRLSWRNMTFMDPCMSLVLFLPAETEIQGIDP